MPEFSTQQGPERRVLLSVEQLQKVYTTPEGPAEAVRDLTFSLREAEFVCLVGPSGSGKTTLLNCVSGLLAPTSGKVVLGGEVVTSPPRNMAMVFQEYSRSLYPWMRVEESIELPLKTNGLTKPERRARVSEALESVGLDHVPKSYPWQLSGGMQQRVAIARAIAYQPEVLLMDEPFAAVDAQTRADLEDLVRSIWEQLGLTILFVTHDIDESVYLGERVIVLSSSPTVVQEDLAITLPSERDQLVTRSMPKFVELRTHVYEQIQRAKREAGEGYGDAEFS